MKYIDVSLYCLHQHPIMCLVLGLALFAIGLMILNAEVELAEVEYEDDEND